MKCPEPVISLKCFFLRISLYWTAYRWYRSHDHSDSYFKYAAAKTQWFSEVIRRHGRKVHFISYAEEADLCIKKAAKK